jgi:sarcosine oxidase subunit alpha
MRFDGRDLAAHPGDTLASALLANGVRIVARSFKYHRPRGVFGAGVEEPNALVQLRTGARSEPNTLATTVEAYEGLEAKSQNNWPSVKCDFGAVNGWLSQLLPAGFYYKTFIGLGKGTGTWMFFEKFIRRAAGMGRAVRESDPDSYEKINEFCDVLVIGAGPTGLAAALAAGRTGARIVLAEQDCVLGGSLLRERGGGPNDAWLSAIVAELEAMANVRILRRTTVFGAYDSDVYGLVERVWDHVAVPPENQPRQRYWLVRSKAAVMATGAIERPIVFSGNDLPGVMLASAARLYVNRFGVLAGRCVTVLTNNDSAYATAHDMAAAGALVTLVDVRQAPSKSLLDQIAQRGVKLIAGHGILAARGGKILKEVEIGSVDAVTGRINGRTHRIACDVLAVSGGWVPTLHLWSQRGKKPDYQESLRAFVPNDVAIPSLLSAGACRSDCVLNDAIISGFAQGVKAAGIAGRTAPVKGVQTAVELLYADSWSHNIADVSIIAKADGRMAGNAFVDLQHDTTLPDIDLAYREGYVSVEHMKRYTTAGMAADQGKTSNINALVRMAHLKGAAVPDVGTTTFRPPFTPVSFGAIVGHEHGRSFHPTRLSPIHDWHVANGAQMTEAGAWLRPWYYPKGGETARQAHVREAVRVRQSVGLVDISTLGKIAIQGPDAAELLDRAYVNGFKSLKIGRIRYGVMLRDDGFVLDDGTTARLSETDYMMSTTTANAAKVLAILEHLLQTSWCNLKVHVTSVTDQWAAIAVAGPKSRRLLQSVIRDADLSAQSLPNMTLTHGLIAGAPVRIHRMSYSGELAYEVYIPSGYGLYVWNALIEAGRPFDAAPYGTEAMGTLRIEKGHVAASEIDGRTTLKDLSLEGLASKSKPFIGAVLRKRPRLEDVERPTLVGLEVLDENKSIYAGSLLFPSNGSKTGHGDGHVTSVAYSPALCKSIGLGLLARGSMRIGEVISCVDFLANRQVSVRVVSPKFYDPAGERQNA